MQLNSLARNKDITADQLKWAILLSTPTTIDMMRDVTEFLEVLNQNHRKNWTNSLEPTTVPSQSTLTVNNDLPSNTLGSNINLQTAYNRMTSIRSYTLQLDLLARNNDITVYQLVLSILFSSAATIDMMRDVTEFLEVLNQKVIICLKQRKN